MVQLKDDLIHMGVPRTYQITFYCTCMGGLPYTKLAGLFKGKVKCNSKHLSSIYYTDKVLHNSDLSFGSNRVLQLPNLY